MAVKDQIIGFDEFDLDHVIADIEEIRRYNPQRYEIEQLTAIVFSDKERGICVGYKDVGHDEFWIRGHMPGMPIMPGVLMCEAGAQMCAYFVQKYDLGGAEIIAFAGMENVRFRDLVVPGDRLVIMAELLKVRRGALVRSRFQGFVREHLVVEGTIMGGLLPADALRRKE